MPPQERWSRSARAWTLSMTSGSSITEHVTLAIVIGYHGCYDESMTRRIAYRTTALAMLLLDRVYGLDKVLVGHK